jgi:HSP20 family protein
MIMFKSLMPWSKPGSKQMKEYDSDQELAHFRENFDRMVEKFWSGDWEDRWGVNWGYEVQDSEDAFIVRAEAPGFEPDEIDVQLSGGRLVVKAEHKSTSKNGNGTHYGRLYRSMTVPSGIDPSQVQANYRNGVLEIHLPKGQQAHSKRIAVSA